MKEITILKKRILHNLKEAGRHKKSSIIINVWTSRVFPSSFLRYDQISYNLCLCLDKKYYPINYYNAEIEYAMAFEEDNGTLFGPFDLNVEESEFKRRMKLLIFS